MMLLDITGSMKAQLPSRIVGQDYWCRASEIALEIRVLHTWERGAGDLLSCFSLKKSTCCRRDFFHIAAD